MLLQFLFQLWIQTIKKKFSDNRTINQNLYKMKFQTISIIFFMILITISSGVSNTLIQYGMQKCNIGYIRVNGNCIKAQLADYRVNSKQHTKIYRI